MCVCVCVHVCEVEISIQLVNYTELHESILIGDVVGTKGR